MCCHADVASAISDRGLVAIASYSIVLVMGCSLLLFVARFIAFRAKCAVTSDPCFTPFPIVFNRVNANELRGGQHVACVVSVDYSPF